MVYRTAALTLGCILLVQSAVWAELEAIHRRGGLGNLFSRLQSGKPVTIAYLGGSITAGSGASHPSRCWREATFTWFSQQFPKASITQADASIGGTGSTLGAFRLKKDVLARKPDMVFVEFVVNDTGTPDAWIDRAMEGIVRQIRKANPFADICFIYTLASSFLEDFREGRLPQAMQCHERIADRYGIPSINVALAAGRKINAGEMPWDDFSKDSCHPTDMGYALFTEMINGFLQSEKASPSAKSHRIAKPLVPDCWQNADMIDAWDVKFDAGWQKDEKPSLGQFPHLLVSNQPDAELSLEFTGDTIGAYYFLGPDTGMFAIRIDDGPWQNINPFDEWAQQFPRPHYRTFAADLSPDKHTLRLKVLPAKDERSQGAWTRMGYFLANGKRG